MPVRLVWALLLLLLPMSTASAQRRTTWLPVVGSAPETGAQLGGAAFLTNQPVDTLGTRTSSLIGNAVLTTKGQQRGFVELDLWSAGNARRLVVLGVASRFPLPFHGFGDATPKRSAEFVPSTLDLGITRYRLRAASTWTYTGIRGVLSAADAPILTDSSACGTLICLNDGTASILADLGPLTGWTRYAMGMLTMGRVHDSRDNLFAPYSGRVLDISLSGAALGSSERTATDFLLRTRVDARIYRRTAGGSVWAGQLAYTGNAGDVPLDQVAMVGHHSLNRGYVMGRYRDLEMLSAQAEWRSPTRAWRGRLGMAAFAGVAALGGEAGPLFGGRALPSAGAGLRFRMDARTRSTIRVDYARGVSGQSGLYVAFNEAF